LKYINLISLLFFLVFSCNTENSNKKFAYIKSTDSNINFSNTIVENDSVNVVTFQYTYNGGGVGIGDFNNDGLSDIVFTGNCENLLFINQGLNTNGIPTFKEEAKAYQLNDGNYSQQAVFFDFDTDGDLDVFIAHNGNVKFDKNSPVPKHYMPKNLADVLLINETKEDINHPVFRNVSDSLGITYKGFSLGVTIH